MHKFSYRWYLKDGYPAKNVEHHGKTVFDTFSCGGGSTMGCKLAGYKHLGGVEIDKPIADVYRLNHNPVHLFNEDIRTFNQRTNLPPELYNLDLLSGSPPCSSYSMCGSREKAWGKEKQFAEGQKLQKLDDLVFMYCQTIDKLKPKVFTLENVKGLLLGNAKAYAKRIYNTLSDMGYSTQIFLLNAADMGVPQRRERVFFVGHRKELNYGKLNLSFNEKHIVFSEIDEGNVSRLALPKHIQPYYKKTPIGKSVATVHPKGSLFNTTKLHPQKVSPTIAADDSGKMLHPTFEGRLTNTELMLLGSYPMDYNFDKIRPKYLIGMSVPPVMMAQVANQIYEQWLK